MLLQSKMERWSPPSPSHIAPPPSPNPNPNPDPTLNRPLHSINPPARPIIIESGSSQIPNDNALFQHVCVATDLGELTLTKSAIMLVAKRVCFAHTPHTPCCHHYTAMLKSMVFNNPPCPTTPTPPPPPPTAAIITPQPEQPQPTNGR